MQFVQVTPLSTSGQLLNALQHELSVAGAGQEAGASGLTHLHSMSDVPEMAWLQGCVYFSSQLSAFSSAAATHTCPKLSQYLSQRPLYGAVSTRAMQSAQVTPLSTSGQVSKELQHPSLTAWASPSSEARLARDFTSSFSCSHDRPLSAHRVSCDRQLSCAGTSAAMATTAVPRHSSRRNGMADLPGRGEQAVLCCYALRLECLVSWDLLIRTHTIKSLRSVPGCSRVACCKVWTCQAARCLSAKPLYPGNHNTHKQTHTLGSQKPRVCTRWLEAHSRFGLELFAWFLPCASWQRPWRTVSLRINLQAAGCFQGYGLRSLRTLISFGCCFRVGSAINLSPPYLLAMQAAHKFYPWSRRQQPIWHVLGPHLPGRSDPTGSPLSNSEVLNSMVLHIATRNMSSDPKQKYRAGCKGCQGHAPCEQSQPRRWQGFCTCFMSNPVVTGKPATSEVQSAERQAATPWRADLEQNSHSEGAPWSSSQSLSYPLREFCICSAKWAERSGLKLHGFWEAQLLHNSAALLLFVVSW